MKVGYARVSSTGQNIESQVEALQKVGCERIFEEKKSGKQTDNREALQLALDFVRDGDEFYVTRLDRCSRSVKDLHTIIDILNKKNVSFKATEQDLDTSTSTGRLMIGLLAIVSEFETDLRAERQADGIKSAQKRGVKFGATRKLSDDEIIEMIRLKEETNRTVEDIGQEFGISRDSVYRIIKNFKTEQEQKHISSLPKSTNGYIRIDFDLNIIDEQYSHLQSLINYRKQEVQEKLNQLIASHTSDIYKDIDFKKEIFEVSIKSESVNVINNQNPSESVVLKKALEFTKSVNEELTDTSMLIFN